MAFFDSLFSELFPKKKENSPLAQHLLKETIKRTKFFMLEYEQWVLAKMHHGLQNHLDEMRRIRFLNPSADVNFFVHQSKLSNGFYFYLEEPWAGKDYAFFVQYIIEKLKEKGYFINNSLREAKEQGGELLVVEEFYLKPSLRYRKELPYEQLFGNVHLELKSKNDEVQMVKVLVNAYSDRNFKEALSYEKFLNLFLLSD